MTGWEYVGIIRGFGWYHGDGTDTMHFAAATNFINVNIPPMQKNHGISPFFRGTL